MNSPDDLSEDMALPCAQALVAGTVALMTVWADPCPDGVADVANQRLLVARKIVSNLYFLKAALNVIRKQRGLEELDAIDFLALAREKMKLVQMDEKMMHRSINEGFSGGEKKRNEVLQMAVLEPRLAILDETDSGLDIDALRVVSDGVNALRSPERAFIVVTHYQRLLNYIVPDRVHVLSDGLVVKSGGRELALELEEKGYGWLEAPRLGSGQAAVAGARK